MASVGASRRRAPISGPSFRTNAFMRRRADSALESASAGTNGRQTLRSGKSLRTLALIVTDASATVEAGRGADGAAVESSVEPERAGALAGTMAPAAVEARRITLEVLASSSGISVGTNATDSFVPAKSAVVAKQGATTRRFRRRRQHRRRQHRRRRFRRRFRTRTGVAFFGLSRRRPFLGGNASVALLDRGRRVRTKRFPNSSSATASRRARRPRRPRQHGRSLGGGRRRCCGC